MHCGAVQFTVQPKLIWHQLCQAMLNKQTKKKIYFPKPNVILLPYPSLQERKLEQQRDEKILIREKSL